MGTQLLPRPSSPGALSTCSQGCLVDLLLEFHLPLPRLCTLSDGELWANVKMEDHGLQ